MVNYGTPIISIVDVNYDVRQPNPAYLNLNAYIQSSTSSPVYVQVVSSIATVGSISTIGTVGIVSTVGSIGNISTLGIVSSVGYIGTIGTVQGLSTLPSSPLYSAPAPVSTFLISTLVEAVAYVTPYYVYIGGAKQLDIYIYAVASTLVSTATYSFSVNIAPFARDINGNNLASAPALFNSTLATNVPILFLSYTENSSTYLGNWIEITLQTISTLVYGTTLGVIPK
ncbi:MAG: hypothetical protein QW393_04015 [Candidatus Micrarchaeaceae archaeon]